MRDHLDVRLRLLNGDATLQLRLKIPIVSAVLRIAAIHRLGHPDLRAEFREPLRHDPNQRGRHTIQHESLAQDRSVLIEALNP